MSQSEWKGPLFDPPHVRQQVEQQMRIEQPADVEVRQVVAPPLPGDPRLAAELWAAPAEQPPNTANTIAALSMALYLLQTVHTQDKPGYEHLSREEPRPDDEDDATR